MNIDADTLTRVYALAHDSGKVDDGRLARALQLVPKVVKTFTHVYTDKSRIEEYFIPGSAHTGYVVTVRNGKSVSACTCADSQQRDIRWCKHALSVALIVRANEIEPGSVTANTPAPVSDRVASLLADPEYRKRTLANMFQSDAD